VTDTTPGRGHPSARRRLRVSAKLSEQTLAHGRPEAGGTGDVVARIIAQGLSDLLGQPVVVDNRTGVLITGEIVAKAAPDGYTVLILGNGFYLGPYLQKTPYDPIKDFAPVSVTVTAPTILGVHPSLPAKSVKELIALAKAKPGQLNYASTQVGAPIHLA